MSKHEAIPVEFNGAEYVWLKNDKGSGPLAYPHHVGSDGEVMIEHCLSTSFAHIYSDGQINRFGAVIGTVDDLKFLPKETAQ